MELGGMIFEMLYYDHYKLPVRNFLRQAEPRRVRIQVWPGLPWMRERIEPPRADVQGACTVCRT